MLRQVRLGGVNKAAMAYSAEKAAKAGSATAKRGDSSLRFATFRMTSTI